MKKPLIRKTIRIDGKPVTRSFKTKEAAEHWYAKAFDRKKSDDMGLSIIISSKTLFKDFALGEFMRSRRANYPESTWRADEQRLRSHVLPELGQKRLAMITSVHVRSMLAKLVTQKSLSPQTRSRVRALVSSVFNSAINRDDGPLVTHNPTFGLSFKGGKRVGAKAPSHLSTTLECERYLDAAEKLSPLHFAIAHLGLSCGLRKQEMIALRWRHVDVEGSSIEIAEKFMQASGRIVAGTKAGEASTRHVPVSDAVIEALARLRVRGAKGSDFVLANADGSHLGAKQVYTLNAETCARAGVKVTVHGLRHSFGREFAQRSGNIGALKDILGHTNIAVTQQYSTLGKDRLSGFRSVVSYKSLPRQIKTSSDGE